MPRGDVGLVEESDAIAFAGDKLVQLLDLAAELDGQRVRLRRARISDSLDGLFSVITPREISLPSRSSGESARAVRMGEKRARRTE
jgi:hypothetical protein